MRSVSAGPFRLRADGTTRPVMKSAALTSADADGTLSTSSFGSAGFSTRKRNDERSAPTSISDTSTGMPRAEPIRSATSAFPLGDDR